MMSLAGSWPDPLPAFTLAALYKTRALSPTASLTVLSNPASGVNALRADIVYIAGRDGQQAEEEAEQRDDQARQRRAVLEVSRSCAPR